VDQDGSEGKMKTVQRQREEFRMAGNAKYIRE